MNNILECNEKCGRLYAFMTWNVFYTVYNLYDKQLTINGRINVIFSYYTEKPALIKNLRSTIYCEL
jgi:hypothetical protein